MTSDTKVGEVYLEILGKDAAAGVTLTPERMALEKKLVRKIDLRLMPMMMLICMFRI